MITTTFFLVEYMISSNGILLCDNRGLGSKNQYRQQKRLSLKESTCFYQRRADEKEEDGRKYVRFDKLIISITTAHAGQL